MAFQQSFGAPTMRFLSQGDKQKWDSVSESTIVSENSNGCFDCNICLDSSHDPVVTMCGHLYCWPCIYRWLQVESSSFESDELPKCPVCKAFISSSSLVPLYGRGTSSSETGSKKPSQVDLAIPQRPSAQGMNGLLAATTPTTLNPHRQNYKNSINQQQTFPHAFSTYSPMTPSFGAATTTSFVNPTINMVGEMVFAGIFGSSDSSLFTYPYANAYMFPGNGSPRLRRQEMQLDKSLNRVSLFLFCCLTLCLILF